MLLSTLKNKNTHIRDENISFKEDIHKYTIIDRDAGDDENTVYTSVTTFIHSLFNKFDANKIIEKMKNGKNWNEKNKYWGMTDEEIKLLWENNGKEVSGKGTSLHNMIECFMNQNIETLDENKEITHLELFENYENNLKINDPKWTNEITESMEWEFFLKYIKRYPDFVPYRTEMMIYSSDIKIAGSIDMLYKNNDGTFSIYDWKRCKSIDKSNNFNDYALVECINCLQNVNFWHYTIQLNMYKYILESKYNMQIRDMHLVRLHPNNPKGTFDLIKLPNISVEIGELVEYRKSLL